MIRLEESPTGWVREFGTYTDDNEGPAVAGQVAEAVATLMNPQATLDLRWGPGSGRRPDNRIVDQVSEVADLAPRLTGLAREGYVVGWEVGGDVARVVAKPRKAHPIPLAEKPAKLRAMVRSTRDLNWPGDAHLELHVGVRGGEGTCQNSPRVVGLQSTAQGPAATSQGPAATSQGTEAPSRATSLPSGGPGGLADARKAPARTRASAIIALWQRSKSERSPRTPTR